MSAFLNVFVEGTPKAQPRPRACIRGKHAGVYDAGTADGWKWLVGRAVKESAERDNWAKTDQPIGLTIIFTLPRPKNHFCQSKARRGELKDGAPHYHCSKPDLDNYAKAVMDAISDCGAIWEDDSQVARMSAEKRFVNSAAGACDRVGAFIIIAGGECR